MYELKFGTEDRNEHVETNALLGLFDVFRISYDIDSFLYYISIKLALSRLHSHKSKSSSNECLDLCPRNVMSKFHGITSRIEHRMGEILA